MIERTCDLCGAIHQIYPSDLTGKRHFCSPSCRDKAHECKPIYFYVDNNECHICISHARSKEGYPKYGPKGNHRHMVRVLWERENGIIPKDRFCLHMCDNPNCINLEHIFIGTSQDNVDDSVKKNRHTKGEICGRSKLTEIQVKEIRNSGGTLVSIARKYKITYQNVKCIKERTTWKHV